jgi:hypothetical protein
MSARLRKASILLVLAALAALAGRPAAAADLVLDRADGFIVPVAVNGIVLRLRADPAAASSSSIRTRFGAPGSSPR